MVKEGCLEGVDEVYGLHNIPNFTAHQIRVCNGPIFARSTRITVKVLGHGGHGSAPHKTRDPINATAFILTALNVIKARCVHSKENFTFTITHVEGGSTYNVMPGECWFEGSLRTYNDKVWSKATERIKTICEETAKAHDCTAEVKCDPLYP